MPAARRLVPILRAQPRRIDCFYVHPTVSDQE
jgi:hypothetical protein